MVRIKDLVIDVEGYLADGRTIEQIADLLQIPVYMVEQIKREMHEYYEGSNEKDEY